MSVKAWLQKNQVFDRDLVILFPQYGINDPEKDLKNLTPDQWKKIQAQLKKDRSKELKNNQAKIRLQKKLTKIEKLWRAKRPKKKVKAPKLLSLFTDTTSTTNEPNGSPTKKKAKNKKGKKSKKGSLSPQKKKKKDIQKKQPKSSQNSSPKNQKDQKQTVKKAALDVDAKEKEELWDQYDTLKLSDNEQDEKADSNNNENISYNMPILESQGSVVDMLLTVGDHINDVNDVKNTEKSEEFAIIDENKDENKNEWHYDDALRFSDEDDDEIEEPIDSGPSLFVPMFKLKTQGSVVDMLMDGPNNANKLVPTVAKVISITPPSPSEKNTKDYSITVSCNDDTTDDNQNKQTQNINDVDSLEQKINVNQSDKIDETTKIEVDEEKKEENSKKVTVSLNVDAFIYNESRNTYSLSLSGCKLMKSDFLNGTITFDIKKSFVNLDKSDDVEKGMDSDDKYIEKVLDEIHKNNPDTETED